MGGVGRRWRIAAGLATVGLAAAVAVGGCGSAERAGPTSGGANAGPAQDEAASAAGGLTAERNKQGQPAQQPGGNAGQYVADERAIVYTGSITVRVDNVDSAATRAAAIATGAGGFVGADKRTSNDKSSEASLTLRVPAARFGGVVDEVARLGREESRSISNDDVTEAVIELDTQIANQQASVDSVRRLFGQARTLTEIVSLERELTQRQTELATMQAKKRRLNDLTSLSTITVMLLGPKAKLPDTQPDSGFLAGLKAGWQAFVVSVRVLLTLIGALLPWLVALGVPTYIAVWLARRYGRRARPAGPPAPPAP